MTIQEGLDGGSGVTERLCGWKPRRYHSMIDGRAHADGGGIFGSRDRFMQRDREGFVILTSAWRAKSRAEEETS
ncbi:hypothetical protein [Limobrevibacterium gyesilva]|uniref:Uncharacterized protein n=1 Tax=Limobrevibacterium gyesilva TaxID=2991712 RepID=A0AA42CI67_9PROT|nr:hypothetical protein [Limobrevibacterium gyesilva]MCW3475580.1 hypothetical protein [Limobrevibacterium gyesilva]